MDLDTAKLLVNNDSCAPSGESGVPSFSGGRPRQGFHELDILGTSAAQGSESSLFYVTEDARVFLLRGPGEPACLHRCHALPAEAAHVVAQVDPEFELLARAADDLGSRTTARIQALRAEVRRDRMVAVAALLQETLACVQEELGHLLLAEGCPDPAGVHARLAERLDAIDLQRRRLDDQGINRRGERACNPIPPGVPVIVTPFVHRGEYAGWFLDMEAAGERLAGPFAGRPADAAARIRDAHLRGELWTIARDGLVHVFRGPSTSANNPQTSEETR